MKKEFLKINYNEEFIAGEISEISESIDFYNKNRIRYYFPFENSKVTKNIVKSQIENDRNGCDLEKIVFDIEDFLKKNSENIRTCLKEYDENLEIKKVYNIYLSYYGCDGYFYVPDSIVVNIHDNSIEFIIETIIHELIHLLVSGLTNDGEYSEETENRVDKIFTESGLLKILSKYKIQKFNE